MIPYLAIKASGISQVLSVMMASIGTPEISSDFLQTAYFEPVFAHYFEHIQENGS
jgi:hypothetical protein